ncbi:UDP-N-acetyl-alpha-D-glucosamine C6 dehydratase [Nocardioides dokdonensis FR1436]|uniref:UDP-N-acetyl-alpha-D-glucosamine C6 dehydratase n=1 Tax=Nocardioides dokdonensis FR1436 TaxID=1300347 RepID=A0A1A9GL84_9ACTN|nr:UDP-N-acetyl-alpha-D-glucosamine C6 dehydratase [Nocardioides dokdonensis FR1436]
MTLAYDLGAWALAYWGFALLRYQPTDGGVVPWLTLTALAVVSWVIYCLIGLSFRLHAGRARTGSLEEAIAIAISIGLAGGVMFSVNLVIQVVPRTVPVGASLLAIVVVAWARALWRRLQERRWEAVSGPGRRVIVLGAGQAGADLIASMLRDPSRAWTPVGLLDDDPMKRQRQIRRVPVLGGTAQMGEIARAHGVAHVILALPSASAEVIERLRALAVHEGLIVKVLPAATELIGERVDIRDIRDIDLKDVLGRNQLDTDISAIAGYLTGRRVLVTGAGGSIGSELCRQISRFDPLELMMLDRDESALHAVQLSLNGRALLDSDDVVLCDIRDAQQVQMLFRERRPEVVFHAAALKHLPMLEQYPAEAVKTNVIGTRNVLDACDAIGVERFVNISTDKAANPASVLGYSKRVAECLTAQRSQMVEGSYLSVRFGNVLGSRGSVLTAFAQQIARGGPVTVTDPDVTRYFMTIEEACQLVIQAAAIGSAGEALVLDMGEPISILGVAERLIAQSGRDIRIEFTGLRPGEKMHEELFGDCEPENVKPSHDSVSHVPVAGVSEAEVASLPTVGDSREVCRALEELCATALDRQRDVVEWVEA